MRYLALIDGLRQPQSSRANEDDDPVAARRAAPPGGNLETSRPGVGRPRQGLTLAHFTAQLEHLRGPIAHV